MFTSMLVTDVGDEMCLVTNIHESSPTLRHKHHDVTNITNTVLNQGLVQSQIKGDSVPLHSSEGLIQLVGS